jgi:plasmid stabilization system protein ParE
MKIRFLAIAQREVDDAVRWYDDQIAGLGQEFLDELDRAVRRAAAWPTSCPEIEHGVRRCLLARFPYGLIYGVDGETLVVLAVAHLHRKPRHWVERIG